MEKEKERAKASGCGPEHLCAVVAHVRDADQRVVELVFMGFPRAHEPLVVLRTAHVPAVPLELHAAVGGLHVTRAPFGGLVRAVVHVPQEVGDVQPQEGRHQRASCVGLRKAVVDVFGERPDLVEAQVPLVVVGAGLELVRGYAFVLHPRVQRVAVRRRVGDEGANMLNLGGNGTQAAAGGLPIPHVTTKCLTFHTPREYILPFWTGKS